MIKHRRGLAYIFGPKYFCLALGLLKKQPKKLSTQTNVVPYNLGKKKEMVSYEFDLNLHQNQ